MTRSRHVCTLVPPYILQAIARSPDETLRDAAVTTLAFDKTFAVSRAQAPHGHPTVAPRRPRLQRLVHDAQQREELPGVLVRTEDSPATGDAAVDEAYDGLGATWRLFQEQYGRNSVDDGGMDLSGTVHFGVHYDNAYWDGERMVFGDGDGVLFERFTVAVDIIGHELTHGVTGATADLVYRDQSGALNESVSDVFGVLTKQYLLGQTADEADWLIGAGLLGADVDGVALRSMAAPGTAYDDPRLGGRDPQPAHLDDYLRTTGDNGGVHTNSGIPNKAFHLAATALGGFAWERAGAIWYGTLTSSALSRTATFAEFAALSVRVAEASFGALERDAVADAWAAVGVAG